MAKKTERKLNFDDMGPYLTDQLDAFYKDLENDLRDVNSRPVFCNDDRLAPENLSKQPKRVRKKAARLRAACEKKGLVRILVLYKSGIFLFSIAVIAVALVFGTNLIGSEHNQPENIPQSSTNAVVGIS